MPQNETEESPVYSVSVSGIVRTGTAREVLRAIQANARDESSVRKMSLRQYAEVLVSDAPYFLTKEELKFLENESYPSEFDRALRYLATMQSSGVRILAKSEEVA